MPWMLKKTLFKGGWILSIYTVAWIPVILISGVIISRGNYVAQRLSELIIVILVCEGAIWLIVPFPPPSKVKEEE